MALVRRAVLLLASVMCVALSGCGTMRGTSGTTVHLVDRNGVDMIAAPAGHVSVAIKDGSSTERICGGRMPDAIMDSSTALSLPIKGVGVGSSSTDLALGGRNPQVLIIRELLYRLCEITLNANLPPKDVVELFKDTLPMVSLALTTSTAGTAAVAVVDDGPSPLSAPPAAAAQPQNPYPDGATATSLDSNYSNSGISPSGGTLPANGASPTNPAATSGAATTTDPAAAGTGTPQN